MASKGKKNDQSKKVVAKTEAAPRKASSEEPAFLDVMAKWRKAKPIELQSIPKAPALEPIPGEMKKAMLKLAETRRAEHRNALLEIVQKGEQVKADLGKHAPSYKRAGELLQEMDAVRAGKTRVASLDKFFNDREDVSNHDVTGFLLDAKDVLLAELKYDSGLADEYPELMALVTQNRQAMASGKARAKAERSAQQKAAAGGESEAPAMDSDEPTPPPAPAAPSKKKK